MSLPITALKQASAAPTSAGTANTSLATPAVSVACCPQHRWNRRSFSRAVGEKGGTVFYGRFPVIAKAGHLPVLTAQGAPLRRSGVPGSCRCLSVSASLVCRSLKNESSDGCSGSKYLLSTYSCFHLFNLPFTATVLFILYSTICQSFPTRVMLSVIHFTNLSLPQDHRCVLLFPVF